MPAVLSRLTMDYLVAQYGVPPKKNGVNRIKSLQSEHMKHILRLHRNVARLKPTPQNYRQAAQWVADETDLLVNWNHVHCGVGPGTAVDKKMRELYTLKMLDLPSDIDPETLSPPLSPLSHRSSDDEERNAEPNDPKTQTSGKGTHRHPTPLPASRFDRWAGHPDKYDQALWKLGSYDPSADVKLYDPKIIIASELDPQKYTIQRWNSLDLNHLMRYCGVVKLDEDGTRMDVDDEDPDLDDLDPQYLITVSVRTRELIESVILQNPNFHKADTAYAVYATWVGYPNLPSTGPLCTFDPDVNSDYEWNPDFASNLFLPAIGSPNALRFVLVIQKYVPPDVETETEIHKLNRLIVAYLEETHGEHPTIAEIRRTMADPTLKTKGRTPYVWSQWVKAIQALRNKDSRVPRIPSLATAGKKINKTHILTLLGVKSQWTAACLSSAEIIQKHSATNVQICTYLLDSTGSAVGIDKFLEKLQRYETAAAQAGANGSGGTV
ncbi:hypothetical protein K438DRAFT_2032263 [Mycena galopus ATCC 62051]|nr:hypothetical protein K438DRAFT_2032263 [Mycena galopus ATCC 62051]